MIAQRVIIEIQSAAQLMVLAAYIAFVADRMRRDVYYENFRSVVITLWCMCVLFGALSLLGACLAILDYL